MYLYVLVIYHPLSCSELTVCPRSPGPINVVSYNTRLIGKTVLCKLEINILNFVQAKLSVLYLTCMWSHHKYITRVGDTNERSSYTALFSSSWFLFTTCRTGVAASSPLSPRGIKTWLRTFTLWIPPVVLWDITLGIFTPVGA